MSFIEFHEVSLAFKTKSQTIPIYDKLDFTVERGEFLVIHGPSGRGKSTLLNLVSGFIRPTGGNIVVDGVNISEMKEDALCTYRNEKIGYIFQSFNLIRHFPVRENVAVPMLIAGKDRKFAYARASELLAEVGLGNREKEYPRTLSGGEQQRVAFARAMANKPEIILADEPTGNLDTKNAQRIVELLKEQNEKNNVTVLCVSHDSGLFSVGTRDVNIEEITCEN